MHGLFLMVFLLNLAFVNSRSSPKNFGLSNH